MPGTERRVSRIDKLSCTTPNALGIRINIDELAHALRVIFRRSPLGDLDLAPGSMHVEGDEQIDRSIALILAVVTFELAGCGWDRLTHLADELGRVLVETDQRAFGIGLFGVEIEHILHAGDILAVDLRNARGRSRPTAGARSRGRRCRAG
jgi:hypothetical protein